jgi:hypothetical protein
LNATIEAAMSGSGTGPVPPPSADRIAAWERIVAQVERGYRLDLDNWLNDMDLRNAIAIDRAAGRLDQAAADHLAAVDRRFRRATLDAGKCLWGAAVALREGWHADRQWWYFRRPRIGNADLEREIGARHAGKTA